MLRLFIHNNVIGTTTLIPSIVPLSSIEKNELIEYFCFIPKLELNLTLNNSIFNLNLIEKINFQSIQTPFISENVKKLESERLFKKSFSFKQKINKKNKPKKSKNHSTEVISYIYMYSIYIYILIGCFRIN